MINSGFNPENVKDFEKSKLSFNGQKASGTVPSGTEGNIDLELTDDHLITGMVISYLGNNPLDEVKIQVVHPVYGVVASFVDWYAMPIDKELSYPAKLSAGLKIRIVYKSVGPSNVTVLANYSLHKVLV